MAKEKLTYAGAGVNIEEGNRLVREIKPMVEKTFTPGVLTGLGGFGGLFEIPANEYKRPVLVSATDGVGTKLKVAFLTGIHNTVGIDLVAMCVNDILVQGGKPLFFLDYFGTSVLDSQAAAGVIEGIAAGCIEAGCSLIGGETAELPGFYENGEYDLAGFSVGIVEKDRIIDGSKIAAGDVVIGLASSGLHSNGFSLARKVIFDVMGLTANDKLGPNGRSVGEVLLTPTRIYVKPVLSLLEEFTIKGMAHITGGGLIENIPRVLPKGLNVRIEKGAWEPPHIFRVIQKSGAIDETEMYRVFNNGIGFTLFASPEESKGIISKLEACGEKAAVIGEVFEVPGEGKEVSLL